MVIETTRGAFSARNVINCAGLHSDRVSRMAGQEPEVRIVPFRGEYYDLVPERTHLVRTLIYPVPDPKFPFLGVHFTRRIQGGVDAGPNAVLAFKREGYKRTDFNLRDFTETMTYSGFWHMAGKYWRDGFAEYYRSLSKRGLRQSTATTGTGDRKFGSSSGRFGSPRPSRASRMDRWWTTFNSSNRTKCYTYGMFPRPRLPLPCRSDATSRRWRGQASNWPEPAEYSAILIVPPPIRRIRRQSTKRYNCEHSVKNQIARR